MHGKYDHRKISNIIYSFKNQSSFWSSESPESLLKKEEGLALLSERLEQHLDSMIGHLDSLEPELSHINSKVEEEFNKVKSLTQHYETVS